MAVLSGFLGAGKTTLLNALLRAVGPGARIKVIVNDVGAVNVDAGIVSGPAASDIVGLTDGCVCCSLLSELVAAVHADGLADADARRKGVGTPYDLVLVESTGVSDPAAVAAALRGEVWWDDGGAAGGGGLEEEGDAHAHAHAHAHAFPARLASMVTVVDATTFVDGLAGSLDAAGAATDRGGGGSDGSDPEGGGDDHASIADLLASQVEAADVVVISRGDAASPQALASTRALVAELNPGADVRVSGLGDHPAPGELLAPAGSARAGWAAKLDAHGRGSHRHEHEHEHHHDHDHHHHHHHAPPTRHGGISSFVFSAPGRPFHPARLLAALEAEEPWAGVLRSKGWFWLATRPDQAGLWQAAGGSWRGEGAGPWGEDEDGGGGAEAGPGGSPGQRLVFIGGPGMRREAIEAALQRALLTDEEVAAGPAGWAGWADELPEWVEVEDEG